MNQTILSSQSRAAIHQWYQIAKSGLPAHTAYTRAAALITIDIKNHQQKGLLMEESESTIELKNCARCRKQLPEEQYTRNGKIYAVCNLCYQRDRAAAVKRSSNSSSTDKIQKDRAAAKRRSNSSSSSTDKIQKEQEPVPPPNATSRPLDAITVTINLADAQTIINHLISTSPLTAWQQLIGPAHFSDANHLTVPLSTLQQMGKNTTTNLNL